jgi:predicted glycosyltransferase
LAKAATMIGDCRGGPHVGQLRVLMYSHDTFGLGHLRRCQTIAHELVRRFKGVHVLIISGSQIAGAFDFRARVDFVKIPSVIKLHNGEYRSLSELIDIKETLRWREKIIRSTAEAFHPDMIIVDKEPLGLKGELLPTLGMLKARGCRLVVGLRDVMDDIDALIVEWRQRDVLGAMERFFDEVWVYGPEGFHNPLEGMALSRELERRFVYTGFLRRGVSDSVAELGPLPEDFTLVSAGGGGDGAPMFDAVLKAHRTLGPGRKPLLLVLGPYMRSDERDILRREAEGLEDVRVIDFHNRHEALMARASAVISMAGYNTFCEILSLDKRAILMPRTTPRREQIIRAERAAALGLAAVAPPEVAEDTPELARLMRGLPARDKPFSRGADGMLNGLETVCDRVAAMPGQALREAFLPPAAE